MSHEESHGLREHPGVPLPVVSPLPPRFSVPMSSQPAVAGSSDGAQQPGRETSRVYASFDPGVSSADLHQRTGTMKDPPVAAPVGFTAIGPAGKGPVTFQAPAAVQPARAPQHGGQPVPSARRGGQVRHGAAAWSVAIMHLQERSSAPETSCLPLPSARSQNLRPRAVRDWDDWTS
jgi:hypothetical protein